MSGREVPPQRGDEDALFARYERRLRIATAGAVNTSADIVEDACAFAWMRLLTHQPRRETAFAYLRTIARNEAIRLDRLARSVDSLDRERDDVKSDGVLAHQPPSRRRSAETTQGMIELRERLQALPERERELVFLHAAGWRYVDIAERFGISYTRVNQLLNRASARMRDMDIAEHEVTSPRGQRLQQIENAPPTYIVAALGSPPATHRRNAGNGIDRREWRRLVLEIEDYRERHAISDKVLPLGERGPFDPKRDAIARNISTYRKARGLSLGLEL